MIRQVDCCLFLNTTKNNKPETFFMHKVLSARQTFVFLIDGRPPEVINDKDFSFTELFFSQQTYVQDIRASFISFQVLLPKPYRFPLIL